MYQLCGAYDQPSQKAYPTTNIDKPQSGDGFKVADPTVHVSPRDWYSKQLAGVHHDWKPLR